MKKLLKTTAIVFAASSILLLSGCKGNEAENFVGEWSGVAETSVSNSTSVDTINLVISESGDFVEVNESINSVYKREGVRDRERDMQNTYNLVALSETELGEPGAGENPDNVIYQYNENDDTLIYQHSMFNGSQEVVLKRD